MTPTDLRMYRKRAGWLALFALCCVVEWAAQRAKEWAGKHLLEPGQ